MRIVRLREDKPYAAVLVFKRSELKMLELALSTHIEELDDLANDVFTADPKLKTELAKFERLRRKVGRTLTSSRRTR